TPVDRGHKVLAPRLSPFHRLAKLLRGKYGERVTWVERDLTAKAATNVTRKHANAMLRDLIGDRDEEAHDVWILGGVPEGQLLGARIPGGHRAARLHSVGNKPLLNEAVLDQYLGVLEGSLHVAVGVLPVKGQVARSVCVQLCCTSGCSLL